jgi:hypothetical protein
MRCEVTDTIEERMEAWKEMDGGDDAIGEAPSTTDALSVLDHEKQNSSESLAKIRFLLGVCDASGVNAEPRATDGDGAPAADAGASARGASRAAR